MALGLEPAEQDNKVVIARQILGYGGTRA